MTKIIAVSSQKGGVLKTSIVTNLGALYSLQGKKVLLIDTDTQGNVSVSFGKNPDQLNTSIYDILIDGIPPEYAIFKAHKNINVDILPSNEEFSFFEFDVLTNTQKYRQPFHLLRNNLKSLEGQYDYILIDTPPNLGLVQGNVLSYAHEVIIPFQPEPYAMRSLIKMLKSIHEFKEQHNPKLEILGVLGVLIDGRTSVHSEILQECRKYCDKNSIPMFETIIPRTIRYANSIAYRKLPAVLTERNKEYVQQYYDLMGEICKCHEKIRA